MSGVTPPTAKRRERTIRLCLTVLAVFFVVQALVAIVFLVARRWV